MPTRPPNLHSKAAVGRHCIPALNLLVRDMARWATAWNEQEFGHVAALLDSMSRYYDCLFAHGMWLPHGAALEVQAALRIAGVHHGAICGIMSRKYGRPLFHITEKLHFGQHIADDCVATLFNPRFSWTYSDEDFMGRVKQIAEACTRARGPLRLGDAFFFRWRHRIYVRWMRRTRAALAAQD